MPTWARNLYVLWIGVFIAAISFSLASPFLPLLLEDVGVKNNLATWSGVAFSASFLMSAIMSPVWGSLADRYGRKIMIIRSGIGIGSTYILMAYATSPMQIVLLRALNGLLSGFIPSAVALVATNTPEDKLPRSLGMLHTGSAAGQVMGPLVGGVLGYFLGIKQTLLFSGLTLLLASIVVAFGVKEEASLNAKAKVNPWKDLAIAFTNRRLLAVLISIMMFQAAVTVLQPVLPLHIKALSGAGAATITIGIVYSIVGIATIFGAPFWTRLSEKIGGRKVLAYCLAGAGLLCLPQVFATSIVTFSMARFVFGLFLAGIIPVANCMVAQSVSCDFRGRAFGISHSYSQLGAFAGPLVGGVLANSYSISAVFWVTAISLLATCWYVTVALRPEDKAFSGTIA
ncbi:MAG: MFS transporter [bacterium]|nr:MFS transporter [bacterium]